MLGLLPFQTSAIAVGALAPAGLAFGAATVAASILPFTSPLFREYRMSLSHFVLGCVIVSIALFAHALISVVSWGLHRMQPRTA